MVEKRRKPNTEETEPSGGGEEAPRGTKEEEVTKTQVDPIVGRRHTMSRIKHARPRKSKPKKKLFKSQLIKFKFVEPIDDDHVMEYGLSEQEIMNYRRRHFKVENPPIFEVRTNKTSEMKEEFGTYCGIKKTIKNWLYWV